MEDYHIFLRVAATILRKLRSSRSEQRTPNAKVGSWTLPRATTQTPYKHWGLRETAE